MMAWFLIAPREHRKAVPLSPVLANVLLDEVDKALQEWRHRFARYADDCNIYLFSQSSGERVLHFGRKQYEKLHLRVNE